ncbi:MAG TPA: hypothetical protein PLN56_04195 [Methanoregulaceae archaeon]|nr:MAG: hypothetical protein IPI71_08105 [Methanolinea sp.]HON81212.1 hypothetical protein [Methanoregulaceae archaeon]HPD10183.1 hypothetical protein [Methanoregulaceae archaeon]HRT15188.1 hypothetical protein [Methanoregulaceae archaeon]HRU30695.1 hypothetical protein [Methanoregulaceae archaeon]
MEPLPGIGDARTMGRDRRCLPDTKKGTDRNQGDNGPAVSAVAGKNRGRKTGSGHCWRRITSTPGACGSFCGGASHDLEQDIRPRRL